MTNLELARRGWEALNRRDLDEVLTYIHPDIEWRPALGPGGPEGRVYHGREAYADWLKTQLFEVWEEFRGENLHLRELPDGRILLLGELVVRGKASQMEVRTRFGQLAEIRDGLVARIEGFPDQESALAAAGLES